MSFDVFQEKIRKMKNPSVLVLEAFSGLIPPQYLQSRSVSDACREYYGQMLTALKATVPGVRFGFGSFALLGGEGLSALAGLMAQAKDLGYYVLLDAPEALSAMAAENLAAMLGDKDCPYACDGVVLSAYPGSDILKPFLLKHLKEDTPLTFSDEPIINGAILLAKSNITDSDKLC